MTWELSRAFVRYKLSLVEGMNLLDDAGIISNLCVDTGDIAIADCNRAVDFLDRKFQNQESKTPCISNPVKNNAMTLLPADLLPFLKD